MGCATYFPVNAPLDRWSPGEGYREVPSRDAGRSGELLLIVAFSGGGMRAAALSYGVLGGLAAAEVELGGRRRRLLDEVDLISGVSGGSFTAAYFGLHGDEIFEDYEERFLKRNVQLAMLGQLLDPRNWPRLFSTYFERSELAAEYYDRRLFEGATFADLERRPRAPVVVINATDLSRGSPFGFVQEQFDWICSDLSAFPVSRAVAASSAVPLLLSPVILRNYAGRCGYFPPDWVKETLDDPEASPRRRAHARRLASYLDARRRPYIHLVDGGISDNLGVRGWIHALMDEEDARRGLQLDLHPALREILVILVDAAVQPGGRWDRVDYAPPLATILDAVTSAQINRFNFETLELLREALKALAARISTPRRPVGFHLVHLGFDDLADPQEREYFQELPTSMNLPDEAVERLTGLGERLLRGNRSFRAALSALAAPDAEASPP